MSVYTKGQLVWAKVKGYAWWPATVSNPNVNKKHGADKETEVNFIGDETCATLTPEFLKNFQENLKEFSKPKTKKLQEAIKLALQMVEEEEESEDDKEETQKKGKGRPKKTQSAKKTSTGTKASKTKSKLEEKEKAKAIKETPIEEISSSEDEKKNNDSITPQRVTRGRGKKIDEVQPLKEEKKSMSKSDLKPIKKPTKEKSSQPALTIDTSCKPQLMMEKPGERAPEKSLLSSIIGEPTTPSHIEVTTRKIFSKSQTNSVISKTTNLSKRSCPWFKSMPSPLYISHLGGRNSSMEYLAKKVKASPGFQQKMASIQATKVTGLNNNKNAFAMGAFNSLMIKKLENDLELLIEGLTCKFKDKQELNETDIEYLKILNIAGEFEKNKFSGLEFAKSAVGKLLKSLYTLLLENKGLLNNMGNKLIATLVRVLHKVKDNIIRFCMDTTGFADSFDLNENYEGASCRSDLSGIDLSNVKMEESFGVNGHTKEESNAKSTPQLQNASPEFGVKNPLNPSTEINKVSYAKFSFSRSYGKHESSRNVSASKDTSNDSLLNLSLRMKSCMQLANLLQTNYGVAAEKSQENALAIECALEKCYSTSFTQYNEAIDVIANIMKTKDLGLDALLGLKDLSTTTLKEIISKKKEEADVNEDIFEMSFVKTNNLPTSTQIEVEETTMEISMGKGVGMPRGRRPTRARLL